VDLAPHATDAHSRTGCPVSEPTAVRRITQRHYQALGGLALAAIFLIQLQHSSATYDGSLLANLFVLLLGAVGLLYRIRLSPVLALCAIAAPIFVEHYHRQQFNLDFRSLRIFDVADVLLCAATLTYLVAQYRLQGLWFGVMPVDPRRSTAESARSEASLSGAELLGLIVSIPAAALLAQLAYLLLALQWTRIDLPPRWKQFLVIAWALLLVMFLAAHAFRYWQRSQMDRTTALLMLQDILWQETRSEQRRIIRWIVWRRLRERK
jgi:hypothetical protein